MEKKFDSTYSFKWKDPRKMTPQELASNYLENHSNADSGSKLIALKMFLRPI